METDNCELILCDHCAEVIEKINPYTENYLEGKGIVCDRCFVKYE